jgi:SSS family transporter
MSCGYGTVGFQCDKTYQVDDVTATRAAEIFALGQKIGLSEFNPTSVDWDKPIKWKAEDGGIMTEGDAWGMMVGFGLGLTLLTVILTYLERTFGGTEATSEQFNTAGRSVKVGLTGSVIVSQWTWAATLLQSSNVAWRFGITGPFWYASGATIQILLFGILAIEIKRRAPTAHTFLEIIKVRWGTAAHIVFLCFGLLANLIVSAMLLLGGCAVYNAVAGVNIVASSFVIPLLTLIYTLMGGLKATFLAGYVHTCVIMVILVVMVTTVYGIEMDCTDTTKSCVSLGSASVVFERLQFMTALPVRFSTNKTDPDYLAGFHQGPANLDNFQNRQGSYLTMMSEDGFQFGIINIIANFGTVFVDQSYWQSAIAAKPGAAHKGYILGGMVWFTIPFALATALGLAGNALNVAITKDDADDGLVPPAAAIAMLGPAGGIAVMIQLTMAILSTGSAECIAVSSLMTYDIYRTYINPKATAKQILLCSRAFVVVWALVMAIASIVLNTFGVGLGYVYCFMATALGSAVVPIALSIYSNKLDAMFAILAAVVGMIGAIVCWLIHSSTLEGGLNFDNTGKLLTQLTGGTVALGLSGLICAIGSFVKPMNFDWNILQEGVTLVGGDGGENAKVLGDDVDGTPEALLAAKKWIWKYGFGYSIFLVILWPLAFVPMGTFGKSTFQLWAGIALMWGWCASFVIITLPLYESWDGIKSFITCTAASSAKTPAATTTVEEPKTSTVA